MANSNKYMARYMADRYLRLEVDAIKYKGGKCQRCGYDKCYAAMDFHHRDPSKKDAAWVKIRKRSWKRIKAELDKCDLLCANCHREIHFDSELLEEVEKRHSGRQREPKSERQCTQCGTSTTNKRYCSPYCSRQGREKVDWPEDLPDLVAASKSMSALARQLGVSANAIKKRLRNHFEDP